MNRKCGDCGVEEGQIHVLGCDLEECPICFGQLIGCHCAREIFCDVESEDDLEDRWVSYIEILRIPFQIIRPIRRWHDSREAPHAELITLLLQSLQECPLILAEGKFHEYPKIELAEFGTIKARYCAPRSGRDTSTGEKIVMPERIVPIFEQSSTLPDTLRQGAIAEAFKGMSTSSQLLKTLEIAVDFLRRTKDRQVELPEIGVLKVGHLWKQEVKIPRISIKFFEEFIDEFEKVGLAGRSIPVATT